MALSYFDDTVGGVEELWVTDGTVAGTHAVASASFDSTAISNLTAIGTRVFFAVDDGVHGQELWTSDGTAAGTVMVTDINPGSDGSFPSELTNVSGTLYFEADDGADGAELWKSDGTAAGTVMVKDIDPGSDGSFPFGLTNVNGTLYFQADGGVNGVELWKSDGTAAGTVMVKDIDPGPDGSFPSELANVNGTLYFNADDGVDGVELWKSDGTAAGTVMVKDIDPGSDGSFPNSLTNVSGTLYFSADDGTDGFELWKSDGTAAGIVMVKDINPGLGDSAPSDLTNVNGTLYFQADDGVDGFELWKSDGTATGTVMVKDLNPGPSDSDPSDLTNVNGVLYFEADDGTHGEELWKSDGTAAGTVMVKDIDAGIGSSSPSDLVAVNGVVEFYAFDGASEGLFRSDGTTAGTIKLATNVEDTTPLGVTAGGAAAPTIAGTVSGQTTTSEAPVRPFAHATIGDANIGATDTLTITLGGAGGRLIDGTGFSSLTTVSAGVYRLSGTAGAITSELDAVIFTPTAGAPSTTSKTTFTLSDLSSANGAPTVDSATTVIDSDPAGAPTIAGISESPATGDLNYGKTVALTLAFSENVTVVGRPTITLNDGGTAFFVKGSGTSALTFNYTVAAGQSTASLAATAVSLASGVTIKDSAGNAASLSLAGLTQHGPQIDGLTPKVTSVVASPARGDLNAGWTVTLTLNFSEPVTLAGVGQPTLTLNDRGTATYVSGSGSKALIFKYTVAAGQNIPSLAALLATLPSGATIKNSAGTNANLSLAGLTQTGPQIDTTAPTITGISESPATGDLNYGKTVALTLAFSENVTVADRPTIILNDGGTAFFVKGSGTSALTFNYTVAAEQSTASLAATAVSLASGVTIKDSAGNAASLSLAGLTQHGPQIDGLTPTVTSVVASPARGDLNAGGTVTLTLNFSEPVTLAGVGQPTLTLNDRGTATYVSGSGSKALIFKYTVAAGQNIPSLAALLATLPSGATIKNNAGTNANLSLAGLTQIGPQIDTTAPTITGISESPATGDLNYGKTVALTLAFSENVTVAGRPTITLNDGGTAFFVKGSGTSALTFNYTVAAGQSTASLAATAVSLASGVTIKDSAGNAASLSLAGLTQHGPQIDGLTPKVTSVVASPARGDLNAGGTVTLTLNFSEPVTLAGVGQPTLTLNDRGTATYVSGSGSKALIFKYTVAAGQNIPSLAALLATLPSGATIKNNAGTNANLSLAGLTQIGPQIDTTAPTVTSVIASPATGTQLPGDSITITVKMSESVTVEGVPALSLNDGGSAKYIGGSGTNMLSFQYTVGSSDGGVSALAISAVSLPAGTKILDDAGNMANMAGAIHSFAGLAVDPPIVTTKPDGSPDVAYSEVTGLSYSSYEDMYNSAGLQVAEARGLIGTLVLDANQLSISSSSGSLGVTTGSDTFKANSHANESIIASAPDGDFNGGTLWQNTSSDQVSIWEMNGTSLVGGGPVSPNPGPSWKAIGTGDFNADGFSDLLWQNTSSGRASIWEMNGNTLIGGGPVSPNPGPSWHAVSI